MTSFNTSAAVHRRPVWKTLLPLALLTGFLDLSLACTQYYLKTGRDIRGIFKYIASGAFGKEAFSGGRLMDLYGVLFHFLIAGTFTVVFYLLQPALYRIVKSRLVLAVMYGIIAWTVMDVIVLPFTHVPPRPPFDWQRAAIAALILIVAIGLPVAYIAPVSSSRYQTTTA